MRIFALLGIAPTNDFLQVYAATSNKLGELHTALGKCYTLKANQEQLMITDKAALERKKTLKGVYTQRVSIHEETITELNQQIRGIEKTISDINEALERYNRMPIIPSAFEAVSKAQKDLFTLELIRNQDILGATVSTRPNPELQAQNTSLPDVHKPRGRSENPRADMHAAKTRTISQPVSARARVEPFSEELPKHRIPQPPLPRAENAPRSVVSYRALHAQAVSPRSHHTTGIARDAFFTTTPRAPQEQAASPAIFRAARGI